FQAEDGIRAFHVTGVQTCALPISGGRLGVTDREVTLAAQDGGQEARFLRPRPVLHDGPGDGVDGERREHDPGTRRLVEEDELLRSEERRVGKDGTAGELT